ncbi:DNA-binding transcription factor yap1 [Ascochyta rabiei]|uniref:DNA-binding transcription factor yap1 n=1 Tax=Didymella rabiei TaxID=5454 RepID=UPI00220ABDF5|nr:DNA-binding transcription factor yap1 [Ascochyta rabiei]UPX15599.1 DNA-binding transcription factor yap1 [Ascochyta rabiei]
MSGTGNEFQNATPFYLDATQQDLLLAALASNNQNPNDLFSNVNVMDEKQTLANSHFQYPTNNTNALDSAAFFSPQQRTPANAFSNMGVEESPFVDYLDGDNSFDFDGADSGAAMIGSLPGDTPDAEANEKRKSPDEEGDDDDEEGGGKRREGEDKQAKKPGRKPLTSEPTTKRKAQNRAAQRAFRERKEKHLKDLETKVDELEKASDAANHENGLLRGQVQRLQMELREYRKRLSLNSTGLNRTPPVTAGFSSMLNNTNSNFQFEFPRFGGLPGSQLLENGPLSKPKSASMSTTRPSVQTFSPSHTANGSLVHSPVNGASPAVNSSHSGSTDSVRGTNATQKSHRSSTDSSVVSQSRVFQFNSGSSTHSESPSTSSTSPTNQDSSCGTSPEPGHTSPDQKDTITDGYVCHGNSEVTPAKSPGPDLSGFDFFANQNGGAFEPSLFGEYRDTNTAIMGTDGDFNSGFFNDAFINTSYGSSPFHFGDTPAVQKPNPLEQIERIQDGEEEVVPGEDIDQMLNCHKIWDKLSTRNDFKDGSIDIDNLCSELRAKARCSESGVVVDHKDVEEALKRLPKDQQAAWRQHAA